jgi:hypothetical protein
MQTSFIAAVTPRQVADCCPVALWATKRGDGLHEQAEVLAPDDDGGL